MKTRMLPIIAVGLGSLLCTIQVSRAVPMGTGFTYQGFLNDGGNPGDGLYDLEFKVFDDPGVAGVQQGSTVTIDDKDVIDGSFAVELDFGGGVFEGQARWLEIGVRPGGSVGAFTPLSPRQELTSTPYALYAASAGGVPVPLLLSASVGYPDTIISGTNTGSGHGLYGEAMGNNGRGVYGEASNSGNYMNFGLYGKAAGSNGRGVYGEASNSGNYANFGLYGKAAGHNGRGVYGEATNSGNYMNFGLYGKAAGGYARGVYGEASNRGNIVNYGVYGLASGTSGRGVYGEATRSGGIGVYGRHSDRSGTYPGVHGVSESISSSAAGVVGEISSTSPGTYSAGVRGINKGRSGSGIGVWGSHDGSGWGVYGTSVDGRGVYGRATGTSGRGVQGYGGDYDFYASGPGTNYGSSSSIRWKSNVREIDEPLAKILNLRGVYFDWDVEHGGQHDMGMIAEEVGEVLPEIVSYEENGVDATGMDYSKLTPLLVEAVKTLKAELDEQTKQRTKKDAVIERLAGENRALTERLAAIESMVEQLAHERKELSNEAF